MPILRRRQHQSIDYDIPHLIIMANTQSNWQTIDTATSTL